MGKITTGIPLHRAHTPSADFEGSLALTVSLLTLISNCSECWLGGSEAPYAMGLAKKALDRAQEVLVFYRGLEPWQRARMSAGGSMCTA